MPIRLSPDSLGERRLEDLIRWLAFDAPTMLAEEGDVDWSAIIAAGLATGLIGAIADKLDRIEWDMDGCPKVLARRLPSLQASLRYRRNSQRARLTSLVDAWNVQGIEPLLMSSARTVWMDVPWDYAEELGVLVGRDAMAAAGRSLEELGYQQVSVLDRSRFRRETCWNHPRINGFVTLREMGSDPHLEQLLPSRELLESSAVVAIGTAAARVMPPHVDILHAMLHHHPTQGLFRGRAAVSPMKLFAFARAVAGLTSEQNELFWLVASRHSRVQDATTVWLDASERCFGLRLGHETSRVGATGATGHSVDARRNRSFELVQAPEGHRIALR